MAGLVDAGAVLALLDEEEDSAHGHGPEAGSESELEDQQPPLHMAERLLRLLPRSGRKPTKGPNQKCLHRLVAHRKNKKAEVTLKQVEVKARSSKLK